MATAGLILANANVITMDTRQPWAELVAIRGDRILLVGSKKEQGLVRAAKAKVIDCQGKTVVPGFNDAHCHVFSLIRNLASLDLSPSSVSSITDIKAIIRQHAYSTPKDEWLVGSGYNEFYLAERRHPTRWDVDEVAPCHPVILIHRSLHACVLNSLALSLAGITTETPEPPGGLIDRDPDTGEPNGVVFEMLGYITQKVLPPPSQAEIEKGVSLANRHFLSQGVTSLQDATVSNDFSRWETFRQLKESGKLKSRISMMFGTEALRQFQEQGLTCGSGDSRIRLGGVKIMLSEASGRLYPAQPDLIRQALTAHQAGFQLAIHAVEPSGVEAAVSALEYVHSQSPQAGRRHRIEHCSLCPPQLLKRLSQLQAVIVTQPAFLYYNGERYTATLSPGELKWLYRIRSFLNSGLVVAASSDCPLVPHNPLVGVYAAVTRRAQSGQQLRPQESVSAGEALATYTVGAAYASFEEGTKGSITRGKLADMVILSGDPLALPPEEIKNIRVEMTIVGGEVVWET